MESERGIPGLLAEQLQRTLQSLQEAARGGEDPAALMARIQSLDLSPTPTDPELAGAHLGLLHGIPDPANSQPLLSEGDDDESLESVATPRPGTPVGGGSSSL